MKEAEKETAVKLIKEWCEKKIKDKRRWCSVYCRDEHTLYANKW